MVSTELILAVFGGFWAAVYGLGRLKRVQAKGLSVKPLVLLYRSDRANALFDRLARRRRFWNAFAWVSVALAALLAIGAIAFLAFNLYNLTLQTGSGSPVTLLIPGVTVVSSEALLYFLLSLPVILVVHEGAHGVVARLERIRVKSSGLVLVVALPGAFVEPDEEEFKQAPARSRMKIVAVGSASNVMVAVAVLAVLLTTPFFGGVLATPFLGFELPRGVQQTFYGAPSGFLILRLADNGALATVGVRSHDVVTGVDGRAIRSQADLQKLGLKPGEPVTVTIQRGSQEFDVDLVTRPDPRNASRGLLGVASGFTYYPPRFGLGTQLPPALVSYLFWLWFLSFNIGLFNMLPFYPLDGDGFANALLGARFGARTRTVLRSGLNAFALSLLAGNVLVSLLRFPLLTI